MPDAALKAGWRRHRFDEMAAIVNDRIDDPSEAGVDHYVGLEHLDPDSLTIRRWGSPGEVEATKLRFRAGDIIFGRRRAYQRKVAVADFDGICSAHAMVLRGRPDVVVPGFLPFFMQSDVFMERAVEISVGSLSPTINWKTLANEQFALPPLDEQERLLGLFNACRRVTTCHQEARRSAWQLRIAAYAELTQRGGRHKRLVDTPLGPAPSHWHVASLRDAVVIENHLRKPISAAIRSRMPGPFAYYGPTGRIDSIGEHRLDGTYALIGEDGDHFLKQSIWSMTQLVTGQFNVNNHAHVVRGTERCSTEWFFHFFRHRDVAEWLTKQGASRLKLKKATLEQMPILLPPIEEQRRLAQELGQVAAGTVAQDERALAAGLLLRGVLNRALRSS